MSKVLVIDSKSYETMYRKKLLTTKSEVELVEDVSETIDKDLQEYDLVIVSHTLKNKDGVEVYNNLRDSGYIGDIVITCCKDADLLRPSYNGISGIISKITNSEDFSNYIEEIINN
jgi:response regulator RpfG family c-di-GMP phosphodiesterase